MQEKKIEYREIEGKNDKKMTALTLEYEEKLHEKDCVISDLTNRLAQAQALLAHDGTNTGLPTSQTPPEKKKRIPNARTKTGKKKGGQPGHEKHVLEDPEDDAVTDVVGHGSGEEDFLCPECNGENFVPTGEYEVKYEYDIDVVVKKKKHVFYYYQCLECGTIFRSKYPRNLRSGVHTAAACCTTTTP